MLAIFPSVVGKLKRLSKLPNRTDHREWMATNCESISNQVTVELLNVDSLMSSIVGTLCFIPVHYVPLMSTSRRYAEMNNNLIGPFEGSGVCSLYEGTTRCPCSLGEKHVIVRGIYQLY